MNAVLSHTNTGPPPHPTHQQHRGPPQIRAGGSGALFTAGPPPSMHIAPPPSSRPLSSHPSQMIIGHIAGPPPAPTPLLSSLNQQSTHSLAFGGGSASVSVVSNISYIFSMCIFIFISKVISFQMAPITLCKLGRLMILIGIGKIQIVFIYF